VFEYVYACIYIYIYDAQMCLLSEWKVFLQLFVLPGIYMIFTSMDMYIHVYIYIYIYDAQMCLLSEWKVFLQLFVLPGIYMIFTSMDIYIHVYIHISVNVPIDLKQ
jgi:hypothetical protein